MKSKLKPIINGITVRDINNDMYHRCRWCHYFSEGKCFNPNMMANYAEAPSNIYLVSEEGRLSGVLEETFHSIRKNTVTEEVVKLLRKYSLSEKRIKEVKDVLVQSIDQWFDFEVKDKLDDEIGYLYDNAVQTMPEVDGVEISNPEEHYCAEFT